MEQVKAVITDKNFWFGMIIGFAFGALHHYFGL